MIIHPKKHFNWAKLSTEGGKADEGLRKRFWFFVYCGNMIAQLVTDEGHEGVY